MSLTFLFHFFPPIQSFKTYPLIFAHQLLFLLMATSGYKGGNQIWCIAVTAPTFSKIRVLCLRMKAITRILPELPTHGNLAVSCTLENCSITFFSEQTFAEC